MLATLHNRYTLFGLCCIQAPSGTSVNPENRRNMAEISLICEENLLDTIFHACDTQRRGTATQALTCTLSWYLFAGSYAAYQVSV